MKKLIIPALILALILSGCSFTEQLDEAESAEFTRLLDEFGSKYAL